MDIQITHKKERFIIFGNNLNSDAFFSNQKLYASYSYYYKVNTKTREERYCVELSFAQPLNESNDKRNIHLYISRSGILCTFFFENCQAFGSIYNDKQQVHDKLDKNIVNWQYYVSRPKTKLKICHKIVDMVFEEKLFKSYSFAELMNRHISLNGI